MLVVGMSGLLGAVLVSLLVYYIFGGFSDLFKALGRAYRKSTLGLQLRCPGTPSADAPLPPAPWVLLKLTAALALTAVPGRVWYRREWQARKQATRARHLKEQQRTAVRGDMAASQLDSRNAFSSGLVLQDDVRKRQGLQPQP